MNIASQGEPVARQGEAVVYEREDGCDALLAVDHAVAVLRGAIEVCFDSAIEDDRGMGTLRGSKTTGSAGGSAPDISSLVFRSHVELFRVVHEEVDRSIGLCESKFRNGDSSGRVHSVPIR